MTLLNCGDQKIVRESLLTKREISQTTSLFEILRGKNTKSNQRLLREDLQIKSTNLLVNDLFSPTQLAGCWPSASGPRASRLFFDLLDELDLHEYLGLIDQLKRRGVSL